MNVVIAAVACFVAGALFMFGLLCWFEDRQWEKET